MDNQTPFLKGDTDDQAQQTAVMENDNTNSRNSSLRIYNLRLPIPSPHLYYDAHHPVPGHKPLAQFLASNGTSPLPFPFGFVRANVFNVHGVRLHDFAYVNFNPDRLFVRYMFWWVEVSNHLFRTLCPSDLMGLPCEWDELLGGCHCLRICEVKHSFEHPHLGVLTPCTLDQISQCRHVHDIQPSCRSIARTAAACLSKSKSSSEGKAASTPTPTPVHQMCQFIAANNLCPFGHDFESAREEAVARYWEHRAEARERGSIGHITRDVWGRKLLRAIRLGAGAETGGEEVGEGGGDGEKGEQIL